MQTIRNNSVPVGNSISPATAGHGFVLIALALACFALSPTARGEGEVGKKENGNTAEGADALHSLNGKATGLNNTAVGFNALFSLTTGSEDTATGSLALSNDTGGFNTAYGFSALHANTTGVANTATGRNALLSNTTGSQNTATGGAALLRNTIGEGNTAHGRAALANNTTGSRNTATGWQTLFNNTGDANTADGVIALFSNTTGSGNIALGRHAGINLTTGDNNIDIGNDGIADEANTIRIGDPEVQTATFIAGIRGTTTGNADAITVVIDSAGQLGTVSSSRRFKKEIKPMDQTSEAILGLKPVTFHYKNDRKGTPQFGLIAEEVAKMNPDLVVRDAQGEIYTVRYDAVNAMLLNEFLKQHRKVEQQEATIARQQKQLEALTKGFQKVSDELELRKPAPQMVGNNQ